MRSFLRALLRRRPARPIKDSKQQSSATQTLVMSSGMTAAALYACTMTSPTALGAVPEDVEAKSHHVKGGKGFVNPWDSWRDFTAAGIFKAMVW
jgi:N-acyl-phosphatidylethanolamine-hydrolysing phospholipase D